VGGLTNSTIQVRIVGVRSFYDFLAEEGIRERNPVRRGQSSRRGSRAKQGLVETFPICLLRVPQNTTSRPFTKPVDTIVGQLIDTWKHVCSPHPKIVDRTASS
jgi:site-specific recombinase XerC